MSAAAATMIAVLIAIALPAAPATGSGGGTGMFHRANQVFGVHCYRSEMLFESNPDFQGTLMAKGQTYTGALIFGLRTSGIQGPEGTFVGQSCPTSTIGPWPVTTAHLSSPGGDVSCTFTSGTYERSGAPNGNDRNRAVARLSGTCTVGRATTPTTLTVHFTRTGSNQPNPPPPPTETYESVTFTATTQHGSGASRGGAVECRPGYGRGDENHCHSGPPGQTGDSPGNANRP